MEVPKNFSTLKPDSLNIAIVGCGTAGPAAAILLARQGHRVSLYEKAPQCEPVGAGFLLQPSGMAILKEIDILDKVIPYGSRVERLHILSKDGSDLLNLQYKELGEERFGLGLNRPALLHVLLEALNKAEIPVHWDHEVTSATHHLDGWQLNFAQQSPAQKIDLLLVCDGARSPLRRQLLPKDPNRGYPWGAHWFIGKNNGSFPPHDLHQIVQGTHHLAGFLATGRALDCPDELTSLFWSIPLDQDQELRAQPLAQWKERILSLVPHAAPFLEQITDWSQILTARYGDVRLLRPHLEGSLLFLGDAAHAMSPQLGQGVNLALRDASALANSLAQHPLPAALHHYTRQRCFQLSYYSLASRALTPFFQSDLEWLTAPRRLAFRTAQHLPPARRFMTRTMAGLVG